MINTLKDCSKVFEGLLIEMAEHGYYKLNRYFYKNGKYQNEVVMEELCIFGITKEERLKELEVAIRKQFPNEEIWMEPDLFAEDINLEDFEDYLFSSDDE